MIKSMSGFAEVDIQCGNKTYLLELRTLNSKRRDVSLSLPRDLLFLDFPLRGKMQPLFTRGQLHVKVTEKVIEADVENILGVDEEALGRLYLQYRSMKERLNIDEGLPLDYFLTLLNNRRQSEGDQKKITDLLISLLKKGFNQLDEMKRVEGQAIYRQLKGHVEEIADELQAIEELAKGSEGHYRDRITKKLLNLDVLSKPDQDRIYREVILFADKIDITEELQRLTSHCDQFLEKMERSPSAHGKVLEFLLQEFLREINTIGSKAQSIEITNKVLEMKSVVEKMKEQVCNVE